ncbi:MAG: amidohydrolase [Mucilaginibacter polytrichastri]|nr:amidohydrolase [Mucilaginibacter polytrichastri]
MKRFLPLCLLPAALFLITCTQKKAYNADLIVINAQVYTVDSAFSTVKAFAVKGGKILATGSVDEITAKYDAAEKIDAKGKAVFPGFIDAHAHFFEYGTSLQQADLSGTKSWEALLDTLQKFSPRSGEGWLMGRGWDQNDWPDKQFPDKRLLDSLYPTRPVLLSRIDGHAAIVNQAALDIAGVKPGQTIRGGDIITQNGRLTGVLVDNAVGIVTRKIPPPDDEHTRQAFIDAQERCFGVGLTTVDDCGLGYPLVNIIQQLNRKGDLKMRMYVMLSDDSVNYDYLVKRGPIKTPLLNVRSFKVYADGALGSRGACLLQDYSDRPKWKGFLLSDTVHFRRVAKVIAEHNFQMNTHAIGDSANRTILNIYASVLKGRNDRRWRIEHAQVIDPADMHLFGDNNIIPSVQPTHATSDMYWAAKRLGATRLRSAYAYRKLMGENGWIPLGTDFPVESINPLHTFYAAVERRDLKGFPAAGFQTENALSRQEALRGITIWAAKANFEEQEKGSIEPGKYADFVILDQDIMTIKGNQIPKTHVLQTYVNGEKVYGK